MKEKIALRYGRTTRLLEFDPAIATLLMSSVSGKSEPLSDAELNDAITEDILEDRFAPDESVLIVVPDATREVGAGQIANLLVRRLIANGTLPGAITIIFATGIHRKVTEEERHAILTPFIAQRIKTIDHDPRDLAALIDLGKTTHGIPIKLNKALVEHDKVIAIGGISYHYFAGFTGGRKLICPGLASSRTIADTHRLALDESAGGRRAGVGTGLLEDNAVHEAFLECALKAPPDLLISTLTNERGGIESIFAGDLVASHEAACREFARHSTVEIGATRELVIASCGGYPHDINLIQAHKSLEAASKACSHGGEIILLAECGEGLGRADLLDWFAAKDSSDLAEMLARCYKVNGQTVWNFMSITERFRVRMVTKLPDEILAKIRVERISDLNGALSGRPAYIIADGAKLNILVRS